MHGNIGNPGRASSVNRRPRHARIRGFVNVLVCRQRVKRRVSGISDVGVYRIPRQPRDETGARVDALPGRRCIRRQSRVAAINGSRAHACQYAVAILRRHANRSHFVYQLRTGRVPEFSFVFGAPQRTTANPQTAGRARIKRERRHVLKVIVPFGNAVSRGIPKGAIVVSLVKRKPIVFGVKRVDVIRINCHIAAVRARKIIPTVHAPRISAINRTVVLRTAEISCAIGVNRAVMELRDVQVVIESRPRDLAQGGVARRTVAFGNHRARIIGALNATVVHDEHLLIGRAVILRVKSNDMLVSVRGFVRTRAPPILRQSPGDAAVIRTEQIGASHPNLLGVERVNRKRVGMPTLTISRTLKTSAFQTELIIDIGHQHGVQIYDAVIAARSRPRAGIAAAV